MTGSTAVTPTVAPAGPTRPALRWGLAVLCLTQITSWGVLYYAFPVMLQTIVADTGWSTTMVTGAFSAGLGVSALVGIPVGRLLDRYGPGPVMTAGSVVGVVAVVGIALAQGPWWFLGGWLLAGAAQAALLYPPAFAALTRWFWPRHVRALTIVTLAGGLASTVFAPVTAALLDHGSWRWAYLILAATLATVTIPLHLALLRIPWPEPKPEPSTVSRDPADPGRGGDRAVLTSPGFLVLAGAFGVAGFGFFVALVFLVPLLTDQGFSTTTAAWALGLSGAGQLLGRIGYGWLVRRTSVRARTVGILAAGGVTTAAVAVAPGPAALVIAVAVLAGAARGLFTLLSATAVSDRWGSHRFGSRNGVFHAPLTAAMATAPLVGAVAAGWLGSYGAVFVALAVVMLLAAAVSVLVSATGSVGR
ncbi:MFS transporter [Natronosporangium hydrolyticum]|uniref:MFS transporter n=1 Tax=Natronosporangium hydrolyticum TaxID=2811111 RepID=A0A895YM39_9ACTN|nr:MFS transporter [Natronosporangium hydrolyticum]QSB16549.1 MFS transporter [Natronosporangium hydrolyticum]